MSVVVKGLTKVFGSQRAVDDLSFEVKKGEILGFLGPNGAGKSTTMKMITGYLEPNEGMIEVCGMNVAESGLEVRKKIGYLAENNPLYKDMYVKEYLNFVASVHHIKNPQARISEMISLTGLTQEKGKLIGSLSKGFRQRVGLAQALIHDPEVLILDEPTSGLDMNQLIDIRSIIKELGKTKTLIFSTHIMQEVQALCDRVIIINNGKLIADDPIELLQNRIKGENLLHLEFKTPNFNIMEMERIQGVQRITSNGNRVDVFCDSQEDPRAEIFQLAVKNGWIIIEMGLEKQSVEFIFQKLTKEAIHG